MIIEHESGAVAILSEVEGVVQDIYVTEGATVHAGDLIVQLDTRNLIRKKHFLESQIHFAELQTKGGRLELSRLYRDLQRTQLDLVQCTITSPTDGRILFVVRLNPGDRLLPGTAIGVVAVRRQVTRK
jgi:multidrug resistance efflux pump